MATITSLGFSIFSRYDGSGVGRARRDINDLNHTLEKGTGGLNSFTGRLGAMVTAAAAVGPALVPIGASLLAVTAGFAAAGAGAGSALGIFGLATKGAIDNANTLHKSMTKVKEQLDAHKAILATLKPHTAAYAAEQKKVNELQAQYKDLLNQASGPQKNYITSIDNLSSSWAKFIKSTEGSTLQPVATVINAIANNLQKLVPVVKAVAPAVNEVAGAFAKWTQGPGLGLFIQTVISQGVPALHSFLNAGRSILTVLGEGFRAFAPLGREIAAALERGARALAGWAVGGGFERFIQKVSDNAPAIKDFFKALGEALVKISQAMAGLGPLSLGLTTTLLKLVAALPVPVLQAIVVAVVAIRAAMLAWAVASGIATVASIVLEAAASPLIGLFLLCVGAIALVVVAVAALGVGIFFLVKNWDTVWNAIKATFQAVFAFLTQGLGQLTLLILGPVGALLILLNNWTTVWNAIKAAAQAVWTALQVAWQAVCAAFSTIWSAVSGALQAAWNAVWNAMAATVRAVWAALQAAWNAFLSAMRTAWSTVSAALSAAWNAVWNAMSTAVRAVWTALQVAWNAFLNAMRTAWSTVSAALSAAWNAVWNAMKAAAQAVWTAMQAAWNAFLTAVRTIWNTVSGALQAVWNTFWNLLKTVAQGIWTAMKTAWSTFINSLLTAWNGFKAGFMAAIKAVWDSIKKTAADVWNGIKKVVGDAVNGIIKIINGIIGAWNTVTKAVGLKSLNIKPLGTVNFAYGGIVGTPPTAALARGGVIPGYAPGKDTVHAMLSKGEGVLVPEAVKGLGANFVHWANHHFSHGRGGQNVSYPGYANGGVVAWNRVDGSMGWDNKFSHGGIVGLQGGGVIPPPPTPADPTVPIPSSQRGSGASNTGILNLPSVGDIAKSALGAITGLSGVGGAILGFIGEKAIRAAFDFATKALDGFGMAGDFGKILVAGTRRVLEGLIKELIKRDAEAKKKMESMAVAGSKACQAWAPEMSKAAALAGAPQSWVPGLLGLMCKESGGNPNAINRTDINAKNGVPSQGLMQVIPPTFAAYHQAGTSNNILDPIANMAAAINYIQARYGHVPGSPYALGTKGAHRGWHLVGERGPEWRHFRGGEKVLPNGKYPDMGRHHGGGDFHMPITVQGNLDRDAVDRLEKDVVPKIRMMLQQRVGGMP